MKTFQEIADERASNFGYESIDYAVRHASPSLLYHIMEMTAKEYAKQTAISQREADSEYIKIIGNAFCVNEKSIDMASHIILNTKLVVD